jgi:hypothetical protein
VTTPGKPKKGDAVRVNDRFQVDDEAFARRLWEDTGLKDLILGDAEGVEDGEGMTERERGELWYAPIFYFSVDALADLVRGGEVIGLNPSIRIYRYSKGQFFDCHCGLSSLSRDLEILTFLRRRIQPPFPFKCACENNLDSPPLSHIAGDWMQRRRNSFLSR